MPPPDFETYLAEHRHALLRFATVVCDDPHLAQDVVQEVLLKAHTKWSRIGTVDRPHAYVRRMVVNELSSHHRRHGRVVPLADAGGDRADPADPVGDVERRDLLLRRLAALPLKQRAAVVLRYLEDRTDAEIADVLECAQATVRVHVHHALKQLRVQLADADGAERTTAG